MLLSAIVGTLLVPALYVVCQSLRERFKRERSGTDPVAEPNRAEPAAARSPSDA